jgi:hypothetical protein
MANFLQKVFNQISLQRDERLWMSSDDSLTSDRLQLLAEFPETQFLPQLKLECVANAKNVKLSTALREKGILFIVIYMNIFRLHGGLILIPFLFCNFMYFIYR